MEALESTEFNSNLATLNRVDLLIRATHTARTFDNYKEWFKHLEGLSVEARYKMKEKDKVREQLDKTFNDLLNTYVLFSQNKNNNFQLEQIFRSRLLNFQHFIMDFLGAKGMLLRDKDDRGL